MMHENVGSCSGQMTNADKIRMMSDEELAKYIARLCYGGEDRCGARIAHIAMCSRKKRTLRHLWFA